MIGVSDRGRRIELLVQGAVGGNKSQQNMCGMWHHWKSLRWVRLPVRKILIRSSERQ